MATKLLFCGTPTFAIPSLRALVNDKDIEIGLVLTQPDRPAGRGQKLQPSPVKVFAQKNGLTVLSPESVNASEFIEKLKRENFAACVVVAFGQILKQPFLDLFPKRCVNLHGSLLPRWRGAAPIQRALMAGDHISGVCLQVVVKKLDAGAVIGERAVELKDEMSALTLHDRLSELGASLFAEEFKGYLKGEIKPIEQNESQVTYAHKISKDETRINWKQRAQDIHNQIRGLAMGPFAWTRRNGKTYKIHQAKVHYDITGAPGEVLEAQKDRLVVACGQSSLSILEIQPESKKKMPVSEFLKGSPLSKGDTFEAN